MNHLPSRSEVPAPAERTEEETRWDEFLDRCERGQFQQSSAWARTKAVDGWRVARRWFDLPAAGRGGFQLLWKPSRLGRIGYVSKGPVLEAEPDSAFGPAVAATAAAARGLGIRALIVQPPDRSRIGAAELTGAGFEAWPVDSVIRSTAIADVTGGRGAIEQRMDANRRYELRAAGRRGVAIRWGDRSDLPVFFALMKESCRRQNSRPNPSAVESLATMWEAFAGRIYVGLAEAEGKPIAGLLTVRHGDRMTLWKKGWNEQGATLYANSLLNATALFRAGELGCREADFVGLALGTARTLVAGESLTEAQRRSRDMFNLKFGAGPRLLPAAQLLIVNPLFRICFRAALKLPGAKAKILGKLVAT